MAPLHTKIDRDGGATPVAPFHIESHRTTRDRRAVAFSLRGRNWEAATDVFRRKNEI
jgi:hypothetical protein